MAVENTPNAVTRSLDRIGRRAISIIEEIGLCGGMLYDSLFFLVMGRRHRQPVRPAAVVGQMVEIGIQALPIVTLMAGTIGVMLAIQGIYTLSIFGAESRVTIGIAFSVVREFAPLITGILVAGRSGSALAARIGTMKINQEIDALNVMGINPVRFLVAPALFATVVMVPALTFYADLVGLFSAGLYVSGDLGLSLSAYWSDIIDILSTDDLWHGLGKSLIFAVEIALIGVVNGANVQGGAEGVGKVTTRAVVQSILAIVVTDMAFAFVVTRA